MNTRTIWDFSGLLSLAGAMMTIGAVHTLTQGLFGAPPPPGGSATAEDWSSYIQSLEPIHMVSPLMAHWSGALIGAFLMGMMSSTGGKRPSLIIAGLVLTAGIMNAFQIPGQPIWFIALDFLGYLPAGWLGWKLALRIRPRN